jgi:hypothetical protein
MGMLGLLALWSLSLSALPTPVMLSLASLVAIGLPILIRRELRREAFWLTWAGGDEPAMLNFAGRAQSLSDPKLSFRGPLAGLRGRDDSGQVSTYLWWPDTLSSAARRQLRLVDQIGKTPQTDRAGVGAA